MRYVPFATEIDLAHTLGPKSPRKGKCPSHPSSPYKESLRTMPSSSHPKYTEVITVS